MTDPIKKVVHHRRLFRYIPGWVMRAIHPLLRRFYFVDYVRPENREIHTLVDYLPDQPVTQSTGIQNVKVLAPAEKVVIADPRVDPFVAVGKYYRDGTFVRPPIVVCEIPQARIHVGTGLVCTRDWEVLPDLEYRLVDYPQIRKWKPRHALRRAGVYSTIFSWNAENFGHWMFDFLPRMHSLAKAEPKAKVTLIMPDFLRAALRESLELVMPSNFSVEYQPRDAWLELETFLWPTLIAGRCNFLLPAEYFESIRRPIFSRYGLPEQHIKTRRIFVTRRHAVARRVLNEADVSRLLARYGFEDIELSELSFRQQVELFHQAEIVAGPHGAGLSSILFSGDIKLVVFYATQLPLNHWHTLARGLGQEHHFLLGNVGEDDSFEVDLAELERVLREELGLRAS